MFKKLLSFLVAVAVTASAFFLLFDYIPELIEDKIYRTEYEQEVTKWCREYSVDPALVYSVIKVESNFDPGANSSLGAIGLMQMIEDSFDWVAWRTDTADIYRFEDLYSPEVSIMFGTYMIGFLYDRYGSVELAAAAYHAGMNRVDSWIDDGIVDPYNVDIESIQGDNTRHYVSKIIKAYKKYSEILSSDERKE